MTDPRTYPSTQPPAHRPPVQAYVAPMTVFLCHEDVPCSGGIFEAGGGWFAQVKWARTAGVSIPIDEASVRTQEV